MTFSYLSIPSFLMESSFLTRSKSTSRSQLIQTAGGNQKTMII